MKESGEKNKQTGNWAFLSNFDLTNEFSLSRPNGGQKKGNKYHNMVGQLS